MITTDPWVSILSTLTPEYNKLKDIIENGPDLYAGINTVESGVCIDIQEDWKGCNFYDHPSSRLMDCIQWVNDQLESWPYVNRITYSQWMFQREQDAEKFITLFNLIWSR
jgi:hypothetical protein